jgi:TPR repeat protein
MSGYFCIAMLEDPPYSMIVQATAEEPGDWLEELPLPSHLLSYEYFDDADEVERRCLQRLNEQGITAKAGKAFIAKPYEVIAAFLEVCEKEDDIAIDEAERLYQSAQELDADDPEVFKLFSKAAECGHIGALVAIAECFYYGGGGCRKNHMKAFGAAKRAIESLHDHDLDSDLGESLYLLARGLNDAQARFILLNKLADIGYIDALLEVAQIYSNGESSSFDIKMALKLIEKIDVTVLNTSQKTDLGGIYSDVGQAYRDGCEKIIPDMKKAVKYYKHSADLGYKPSITDIAWCYFYGEGVKKDLNEALELGYRLIDMGWSSGYSIATKCYDEVGMQSEAIKLWKQFFKNNQAKSESNELVNALAIAEYAKQVLYKKITAIHTKDDEQLFSKCTEILKKNALTDLYEKEIKWLDSH